MRRVQGYGVLLMLLASGLSSDWSRAQNYPTKPVRIQTSGAGGGNDTVTRIVAAELGPQLGQQVVVENRPSGNTLMGGIAKAAPDGYTLLIVGSTMWVASLFEDLVYDPIKDFAPISPLTRTSYFLIVHPSLPVKSVEDVIRLAKAKPGALNYSTGPVGGSTHLAAELFKSLAGVDIVRISYKASNLEIADLLAGQVHMNFGPAAPWLAHIKAGKLRLIAAAGTARSALYPELPTIADTLPGYLAESLNAFFAPAKTPDAIIRRLNQEALRALDKPEVRQRLLNGGQEAAGGQPEQLTAAIKSEIARMSKLAKEAGIKPEN